MNCKNCNGEIDQWRGFHTGLTAYCSDGCRYEYNNRKRKALSLLTKAHNSVKDVLVLADNYPELSTEIYNHLRDLQHKLDTHDKLNRAV